MCLPNISIHGKIRETTGSEPRQIWIQRTRIRWDRMWFTIWLLRGQRRLASGLIFTLTLLAMQGDWVWISAHRLRAWEHYDSSPLMFGTCVECRRSFLLLNYICVCFEWESQWYFNRYIIFSLQTHENSSTCCGIIWSTIDRCCVKFIKLIQAE